MPGIDRSKWPSSQQEAVEEVGPVRFMQGQSLCSKMYVHHSLSIARVRCLQMAARILTCLRSILSVTTEMRWQLAVARGDSLCLYTVARWLIATGCKDVPDSWLSSFDLMSGAQFAWNKDETPPPSTLPRQRAELSRGPHFKATLFVAIWLAGWR